MSVGKALIVNLNNIVIIRKYFVNYYKLLQNQFLVHFTACFCLPKSMRSEMDRNAAGRKTQLQR